MPANDKTAGRASIDQMPPASGGETVTPHDTNELTSVSRGLYVGVGGNVAVVMADGTALTFVGVAAGTLLPLRVKQVKATNTTATSMVAVY